MAINVCHDLGGVIAIDTMHPRKAASPEAQTRFAPAYPTVPAFLLLLVLVAVWFLIVTVPAFAGQSAIGEPVFYPCTSCHPLANGKPSSKLPNGFTGHQIELVVHDKLGEGSQACLVCHDDPARDPGKLRLVTGELVDVTGDVSRLCYQCHSQKYGEWQQGVHGKNEAKCTSSGCHDPHSPSWIYTKPLLPFVGTGFQTRAVSERAPFTPFASAPVPAPVETPWWLTLGAILGGVVSTGLIGFMTLGRFDR